jgi:hypothetical protein
MKQKKVMCGKCTMEYVVFNDIHALTYRCPVCGTVQGVTWKNFDKEIDPSEYAVEPHLDGEDQYDWDWLLYDDLYVDGDRNGAFDQDNDFINANLGWE